MGSRWPRSLNGVSRTLAPLDQRSHPNGCQFNDPPRIARCVRDVRATAGPPSLHIQSNRGQGLIVCSGLDGVEGFWPSCQMWQVSSVSAQVIPVHVGKIELLVETTPGAGSEPTSALDRAGRHVTDAFERAQEAIIEVASRFAETASLLASRSTRPDRVEVEFGLKFSAHGNVIVAGGSGEATLRVLISYDATRKPHVADQDGR